MFGYLLRERLRYVFIFFLTCLQERNKKFGKNYRYRSVYTARVMFVFYFKTLGFFFVRATYENISPNGKYSITHASSRGS